MTRGTIFRGGGETGALMREVDWSKTPLGASETWPQSLRTAVSILLDSKFPMYIAWGAEFVQLYNDGYRPVLGATKHPAAMGGRAKDTFAESWHIIGPMFSGVRAGDAFGSEDWMLPLDRNGYLEECYFTFSYSPIRDESGGVGGVLVTVTETTARVLSARRLRALHDLAAGTGSATSIREACAASVSILDRYRADVPFALFYVVDDETRATQLSCATAMGAAGQTAPEAWPLAEALASGVRTIDVDDVRARVGDIVAGDGPELVKHAVALPIRRPGGDERPYGVFVAGVSPRRKLDDDYRSFFELVASHVGTAITNAEALAEERHRSERLAEVDRAKTEFFSNISHEFRTPLTLMLGPVEDGLADVDAPLPPRQRERQELVRRNALRLQKLVSSLLDFSRVEAGRTRASFEPVDLAAVTTDLASSFRSVVEAAGLGLLVDCPPLPLPVNVDRGMWEKIVLNLLSNAFKFTLQGSIRVALAWRGDGVELSVRDTGIGVPAEELPRIFERFHRVEGARGRSHEGTGIGLALVRELVALHGGTMKVESTLGEGSTFSVSLPTHLPRGVKDGHDGSAPRASTEIGPQSYLAEIAQWNGVPATPEPTPVTPASAAESAREGRILVVDDNADMRTYLSRLLSPHWSVETVSDGREVLPALATGLPDLILADVMMPGMDGLTLVRTLRASERTRALPIVLLSARAGEEATITGLSSGADDYLVKPFSANELLARIRSQLALSATRREAATAARAHAEEAERLLAEARRAVRSRQETLAVVSHDLRTPLGSITMATALLHRAVRDDARAQKHITTVRRAAARMDRLITDLLDVASIDAGTLSIRPGTCPVDDVLREAREAFDAQAADKGVALVIEPVPDAPSVSCDKERILQAIGNLVSNALKFTPAGGRVSLRAEKTDGGIRFAVRDTGVGVPADAVPHVFDRYWHSSQEGREGHGLGLAITKGIIEGHRGTVHAESEAGSGSTFSFWLPFH